jgi:hypothetical protein
MKGNEQVDRAVALEQSEALRSRAPRDCPRSCPARCSRASNRRLYLAVLPAVLFAARCCGWGPSLRNASCLPGEQYWFIPPIHSLRIVGAAERTGTLVYFFVCLTIIIFAETSRRAMAKLTVTTGKLRQASEELGRSYGSVGATNTRAGFFRNIS